MSIAIAEQAKATRSIQIIEGFYGAPFSGSGRADPSFGGS